MAQENGDPLISLPEAYRDERGAIQPLVDRVIRSALIITARKGSVRGNHRHNTDWHYCYVLDGQMDYYWRPSGTETPPNRITVGKGQMVFTPPHVEHAFVFVEDTEFLTLARNPRGQEEYEKDTTRVNLV